MFEILENKAATPNGYSSGFLKKAWPSIGEEMIAIVLGFFHTGKIQKQINSTTLYFIPKCEQPENVTQFRPIACHNVIYKVISKMLCSRLESVLPIIVDQVQSAFIEKRMIMHNILICQDMFKQYRSKSFLVKCTMKITSKMFLG